MSSAKLFDVLVKQHIFGKVMGLSAGEIDFIVVRLWKTKK